MSQQVFVPFLLTLFAGISTGIGSAIAFFAKRTNTSFLSLSLGFSAGVMIYVSFVELFTSSVQTLVEMHGKSEGTFYATLSFFGGIVLILLIDKLIPRYENPHEMHRVEEMSEKSENTIRREAQIATCWHGNSLGAGNTQFPGRYGYVSCCPKGCEHCHTHCHRHCHTQHTGGYFGIRSCFLRYRQPQESLLVLFLSGLAEPVGAVIGYLVLAPFLDDNVFGIIFGMIAGIMVFISLDELLPAAEEYGKHHHTIYGLVAGMAVMALSLLMLG